MAEITRGPVVTQGKTKALYECKEWPDEVIVSNGDAITKNDDPSATQQLPDKARHATTTTCAVFELLQQAGIPVAYSKRLSDTEFLAPKCQMIPLEVVIRRYGVGSYLKRYPNLKRDDSHNPVRFHRLVFELFLKTTGGKILGRDGALLGETPLIGDTGRHLDDPWIIYPDQQKWDLRDPKLPSWQEGSEIGCQVSQSAILPEGVTVQAIEEMARKVFLVLEGAWAILGCRLIDFKIEFGIDAQGRLVVADVIDNDSWRVRDAKWQELSKQLFRDCESMDVIADKYALVASLVQRFRVPQQGLILWRGSENDEWPEVTLVAGIEMHKITQSGHKATAACLERLERLLTLYPEGGVIVTLVGMSNGLGPILAAHTSWPVIAVPLTAKERPHDVWSSLEMPSNVPLVTALSAKNAALLALNILAQKSPLAYMLRQHQVEELDQ